MSFLRNGVKRKVLISSVMFLFLFAGFVVNSNAKDKPKRGFLGISLEKMSGDDREEFGVKFGVLVIRVEKGEAAFKAGLKKYDVIQFLNGIKTRRPDDIVEALKGKAPGEKVKFKFVRDGKNMSVTALLGERKNDSRYFGQDSNEFGMYGEKLRDKLRGLKELKELKALKDWKKKAYLGVEMRTMDDNFAKYFGVKKDGGALVMKVTKGSAAEKAGILSGDVILKIDELKIKGPEDVSKVIRGKQKGDKVKITVFRHKKVKEINVELGEKSWMGRIGFIGEKNHRIFHIDPPDFNIKVPEILDEVKVWRDSAGNLHKERIRLLKEKVRYLKEKKELKKKSKRLKKAELKEVIEEEVYI